MSADEDGVCRSVRLIETSDQVSNLSYMALSHCWGDADFVNLTTENLSRLLSGIDTAELPETFQDAICLTLQLGAEYLWIDSLCIMQDSESDWEKEAFSMRKVYSNAMCTIAATGAHDPHQGLYRSEDSSNGLDPIPIESPWPLEYFERGSLVGDIRGMDITDSPLLKRAWIIQEMALSSRTLHFAKSQTHWQCQERIACEALPNHYPRGMLYDKHQYKWPETNRGAQASRHLSGMWWDLVGAYSSGSLTKNTDKFAAFAGAAEQFRVLNGGLTYTCGLWRESLPSDLLWSRHISSKSSRRSQRYRAPSWSWLSLDSASIDNTQAQRSHNHCLVQVSTVTVETLAHDAYGPVTAAALQIKGLLKKVVLGNSQNEPALGLWLDDCFVLCLLDDPNEVTAGPAYCLPFFWQGTSSAVGLLLKPVVDGGAPDHFCRIAFFMADVSERSPRFFTHQNDDGIWKPIQPTTFTLV